ncbi:MAG: hypothetical protein ABW223_03735 [Rariglobus sp.]
MRRVVTLLPLVLAIALLVVGSGFLLKASQVEGWEAAEPAFSGLACVLVAAVLIGRRVVRVIAYPVTSLLGHVFYPQARFTQPPESLLFSLRQRIAEGRLRSAEHQILGLLKAYPRDAGLYHVWALLEVARGRGNAAVTAEAKRELSATAFADYEALVYTGMPAPRK